MYMLQQPVLLPCLHYMCKEFLSARLQLSGQIVCADCQIQLSLSVASVSAPSPFLLSLLGDQLVKCPACREDVQMKYMTEHRASNCTLHTHFALSHLLQKPLDAPLYEA